MLNLIAIICLHLYWHVKRQAKGKLYGEVVLRALDFTFTCVDYADGYPLQERNATGRSIAGVARSIC